MTQNPVDKPKSGASTFYSSADHHSFSGEPLQAYYKKGTSRTGQNRKVFVACKGKVANKWQNSRKKENTITNASPANQNPPMKSKREVKEGEVFFNKKKKKKSNLGFLTKTFWST